MLEKGNTYQEVYSRFRWILPEYFNIAVEVCDRWARDQDRLALIYEDEKGKIFRYTFAALRNLSNQLANGLVHCGITRGDRVGILLPQCPETALAHLALYKIGAIAIPLFTLFGQDALEYRLNNAEARALITDPANLEKIRLIRDALPSLETILVTGEAGGPGELSFWEVLEKGSSDFSAAKTTLDDPALIIYTSGTTGPPKGALHAHRVLLGHLPGVEFFHNFFPKQGDLYWTPADWAWIGGLIDVLLPSWYHGVPVVAYRARKFDPEEAFHMIAKHRIRNCFMPPTALKLMRQVKDPRRRHRFELRTVGCGGETLGEELLEWGREVLGVKINEFYGQTEVNLVVGNCWEVMEIRPGSMGRAIPGHEVEVIDGDGRILPPGEAGEVAVKRPDPVMFLEYWRNPEATAEKFIGDWAATGDLARKDPDGYFWFVGRKDDLITSAGYRIGPAEIEDCLIKHEAVAISAVVGKPDPVRGEIVKAFIVLKPGYAPSSALEEEIKDFVKIRLALHEYPREIEFISELPLTSTGKIMRKDLRMREREREKGNAKD